MGSYPSITAVHRLEGKGGGLLCATALDGYVLIAGGKEVHYALPGQLGTDDVARVDPIAKGMLFRDWIGEVPPWRYEAGRWEQDPEDEAAPVDFGVAEPVVHEPSPFCRDGLGRLWVAWGGLWMADLRAWRIHTFSSLPMMGRARVTGVYADVKSPDGVIATLEGRGVVFVRVLPAR